MIDIISEGDVSISGLGNKCIVVELEQDVIDLISPQLEKLEGYEKWY
jgi:hypothetical protein